MSTLGAEVLETSQMTSVDFRRLQPRSNPEKFREHLRLCSQCRLTQYSGRLQSQWSPRHPSDCGNLCSKGRRLWCLPDAMRECLAPKGGNVTAETTLRMMGFPKGPAA